MVKLNVNTLPSISTAARCSVNIFVIYSGNRDEISGTPSMEGVKPGPNDGTESWSDHLIQFNQIAEYYHWRDYEKALQLAIHLR